MMKMLLYPVNSIHDVRVGRSGVPLDLRGIQLLIATPDGK